MVANADLALEKRKFREEAAKLEKMVLCTKSPSAMESEVVSESLSIVETPNNNPFKIRKVREEVSTTTDAVSEGNASWKQKLDESFADQADGNVEHSDVRELGNLATFVMNFGSQESVSKVDSLDNKDSKQASKKRKSNSKSSEKRGTILNFFSRVV